MRCSSPRTDSADGGDESADPTCWYDILLESYQNISHAFCTCQIGGRTERRAADDTNVSPGTRTDECSQREGHPEHVQCEQCSGWFRCATIVAVCYLLSWCPCL